MAKLIDYSQTERPTPRLQGPSSATYRPAGDQSGKGLEALGRELEQGTEEIYRAQRIEESRINTLRAEEAYTKLRDKALDLTIGQQNGFANLKGSAAVTRPVFKEWSQHYDDAARDIDGTLANDEQRQEFKRRADVGRLQYQETILRHLAQEGDNYAKEVYDGTIGTEQRQAVARWDSPHDVGASLERIRAAVYARAERYGWPAELRDAELKKQSSAVHSAVVYQAIAQGNWRYAEQWYKANRDEVDLQTAKALERSVEDGTQKELFNAYQGQYLNVENDTRSLEALRKNVLGDKVLGEDRKNILVGRIQHRMDTLERRAEVAEARRLRVVERALNELNGNTLAGYEPTPNQFAAVMDAAKGTELEGDVKRAMDLADKTRAFRQAPYIVQERILAEAEAGVRKDPSKFDRRVVGAWRQIYEAQRRQWEEAPIPTAVRQGVIDPPAPIDFSQPAQAAAAMAERFQTARGLAARYQAPFKPLTPEEVSLLKTTLEGASWQQKGAYLGALAQASGRDMQGYMGMMAQLAPDDPVAAIAGSHAARGRTQSSELMLRGESILRPPKKADGKPEGGTLLPMPPEVDMRSRFDSYVREAFAGHAESRNAHYQAAKSIYAALSADAGDKDTKILDTDRFERAMELAIGPVEKYQGRRLVLPHGYNLGSFTNAVRGRIDQLVESGRLDKSWTAERLRDLPLENVGDGRYVLRSADGVVTAIPPYGKQIVQNKDGSISTERTITVEAGGKHFLLPTLVNGRQVPEAEAVRLWRAGTNAAVGEYATAEEAQRAAVARSAAIGRALIPQPVVIDLNVSLPYRPSGEGLRAPAAAEAPVADFAGLGVP